MRAVRSFCLILISVIALSLLFTSCMDMGEVPDGETFKDCFKSVHLLDREEHEAVSIGSFSAFDAESSTDIEQVVDPSEYCYIAFQAARGYTLTVSELAFFARIEGGGVLNFEIYLVDELPEMILNDDGSYTTYPDEFGITPELNPDSAVTESIFGEDKLITESGLRADEGWDSVRVKLGRDVTLTSNNYLVIKFTDNCVRANEAGDGYEPLEPVTFTVNYLLFYFEEIVN